MKWGDTRCEAENDRQQKRACDRPQAMSYRNGDDHGEHASDLYARIGALQHSARTRGILGKRREIHVHRQVENRPFDERPRLSEVDLAHGFARPKIHAPLRNASTMSPVPTIADKM